MAKDQARKISKQEKSKSLEGSQSSKLVHQTSITTYLLNSDRFCRSPSPSLRPSPEPDCWIMDGDEPEESSKVESEDKVDSKELESGEENSSTNESKSLLDEDKSEEDLYSSYAFGIDKSQEDDDEKVEDEEPSANEVESVSSEG